MVEPVRRSNERSTVSEPPKPRVSSSLEGSISKVKEAVQEARPFLSIEGAQRKVAQGLKLLKEHALWIDIAASTQAVLSTGIKIINVKAGASKPADKVPKTIGFLDTSLKVVGVVFGGINILNKGSSLKSTLEQLHRTLIWGSFYDKVEGVLNFLMALLKFVSANASTLSVVGGVTAVILAFPSLVIKLLIQILSVVRSLVQAVVIQRNLTKLNKCLSSERNDLEKLEEALLYFDQVEGEIEAQNDELREGRVGDGALESYLEDRRSGLLSKQFTEGGKKKIFHVDEEGLPYYKKVLQDLTTISQEIAAVRAKLKPDLPTPERMLLEASIQLLEERGKGIVDAGMKWLHEVSAEIEHERDLIIPTTLSSVAAIGAIILGLLVSPTAVYGALLASIVSHLLVIAFDAISLQKKYTITKDQQQWISEIIVEEIIERTKAQQDKIQFAATYGFTEEVSDDQLIQEFKKYLKNKLEIEMAKGLITFSLVQKLKEFNEKELSQPSLNKLSEEFDLVLNALVVKTKKRSSRTKASTLELLTQIKGDHRLSQLIQGCSFEYEKQRKKFFKKFSAVQVQLAGYSLEYIKTFNMS